MKILIIPEYGQFGGTLTFLKRLLYVHNKNNLETAVLIQKNQNIHEIMSLFKNYDTKVYTYSNRIKLFLNPYLSPIFDIFFCRDAFKSYQPDIIVVSNGSPGTMLSVLFFPVPVLFVMHSYPRKKMSFPIRFLCRMATRHNNKIFVATSKFSKDNINRFMGISHNNIEVIYNSFQPPKTISTRKDIRKTEDILTIGHVEWYKDPKCWLYVAKKIINLYKDSKNDMKVRFIWVGDGKLLKSYKKQIEECGLENRIFMHGFSDQIESFYTDAILYFQPSLVESHGISVIDAMARGIPCVTSNTGGLTESIIDYENGFTCSPGDAECFISRIVMLLNDVKLREKIGKSGKMRAETLFSEELQEEKIIGLYKQLLKNKQNKIYQ